MDKDESTPLHLAAQQGHLPVAQYMCEQGTGKGARGESGDTPLLLAAPNGHLHVLQYLEGLK